MCIFNVHIFTISFNSCSIIKSVKYFNPHVITIHVDQIKYGRFSITYSHKPSRVYLRFIFLYNIF